jgi:phage terminase large subunit-like protein
MIAELQASRPAPIRIRGHASPRIAPPVPARSLIREYDAAAHSLGIRLMPWQKIAARYLTAVRSRTRAGAVRWLFREIAIVVARQNGKTHLLLPLILVLLKLGLRILHTAQNRELPRETFEALAGWLSDPTHPERRAEYGVVEIRWANGQQKIRLANGGLYTLVAPRPGVRGHHVDVVILDEAREQKSYALLAGIRPTIKASKAPLFVYLSNAGDEDSIVLNDLRRRGTKLDGSEPRLCYLEWSAAPERADDDVEGWAEANPALGITIEPEAIDDDRRALPPAKFETEDLCRWVTSMQPRLLPEESWTRARAELGDPVWPMLGVSMDPTSRRASAVLAWQLTDGTIGVRVAFDVVGSPIDTDRLGTELGQYALKTGVRRIGFDDWTDQELEKYLVATSTTLRKVTKAINGREFANASESFVRIVTSGRLRWDAGEAIEADLAWTARREHESGAWIAVKASEERPITAVLAAIRAVWLASGPRPSAAEVY